MASTSSIEWTEMTWNPVTGCLKVSQGCKHCYAERMAKRLHAMGSQRYKKGFKPTLHYDLIDLPRRWKKPRVIFVNSMSDLFQEDVPEDFHPRRFRHDGGMPAAHVSNSHKAKRTAARTWRKTAVAVQRLDGRER